jgi:hypothetical protein
MHNPASFGRFLKTDKPRVLIMKRRNSDGQQIHHYQ